MLDKPTMRKISEAVYLKPRTIQEIAHLIGKNWRTADRYVTKMAEEEGTVDIRTFRGGTKGSLKIVYWCNIEKIHSTTFQERLLERIKHGKKKYDFSPFDIFQYVEESKRDAAAYRQGSNFRNHSIIDSLKSCDRQLLSFSGNLSWLNISEGKKNAIDEIEELVKNNVKIKILTRIDVASISNIQKLLEVEERVGKKMIDVRHCEQPLRGMIIDDSTSRFVEVKTPEQYKEGELKEMITFFYDINDEEWVAWLQKVFFNLFRTSVDYRKRLKDLKAIENIEV